MTDKYSLSPLELRRLIEKESRTAFLVEGFLPRASVALLAGDSGCGKTPFALQLGICVAAGIPFLGFPTTQGSVLYADYENSAADFDQISRNISETLGLEDTPPDFRRLDAPTSKEIDEAVAARKPSLLIIDTLRFLDPKAESENTGAATRLYWMKQFRRFGTGTLFIHHMRKQNEEFPRPNLFDPSVRVLEWCQHVSGAQALVNQSDIRMGFDFAANQEDLVVRAYRRGSGEVGPWHLQRILDDNSGDALAYSRISGKELLSKLHAEAFLKLPLQHPFSFSEALTYVSKSKKFVSELLKNAQLAGLVKRTGALKTTRYIRLK